jgi:hypothetical protein
VSEGERPRRAFRIAETGQRVNGLEFELALALDCWRVLERERDRWLVRTVDGETMTLLPVESSGPRASSKR